MQRPGSVAVFALGIIALFIAVVIVMDSRGSQLLGTLQNGIPDSEKPETETVPAEATTTGTKDILEKVRRHIQIATDVEPTVATVVNADSLRVKNASFYAQAENGDALIVTKDRAILYSVKKDIILNVVPVRLQDKTAEQ